MSEIDLLISQASSGQTCLLKGKHTLVIEDDVLLIRFVGTYEHEEAQLVLAIMQRVCVHRDQVFLLVDLSQIAKPPGPATRRVLAQWKPAAEIYTAYFGASWVMRTVSVLIHSAMRLVSNKPVLAHFTENESQARAWLAQQREVPKRSA